MASNIAATRLRKELAKLRKDPPPGIIAEPKESDILTWFFAIRGPPETPYQVGVYVGKLKFPSEYPMKPPSILMLTPSARFKVNTRICMSMSDFHPESWNPLWSVASILQGVVSFMASEELTTGGMDAPESERKRLAGLSKEYNSKHFNNLFDGDMDAAFEEADEANRKAAEMAAAQGESTGSSNGRTGAGRGNRRIAGPRRKTKENSNDDENNIGDNTNKDEEDEDADKVEEESTKELSQEEIEKRKKKNAKKRAKQKAKKATTKGDHDNEADASEGNNGESAR